MSKVPLVSVLVQTYNHEEFLGRALDSVLMQKFDDFEIVIADDASNDRTPLIVAQYTRQHPDLIQAIHHQRNMGVTATQNELLRHIRGTYVIFLSGDDLFLPDKLAKQCALMESDPSCILSYHDVEIFNSDDDRTIKFWNQGPGSSRAREGDAGRVVRAMLQNYIDFIWQGSVMTRREAIPHWGYTDTPFSDMLVLIDIVARNRGTVRFLPEVLVRYRRHAQSITAQMNWTTFHQEVRATLDQVRKRYPSLRRHADRGFGLSLYREAIIHFRQKDYDTAADLFRKVGHYSWGQQAMKAALRLVECRLEKPQF